MEPGELGIYMRERSKNPVWLKPYQDKFARARKRAAEETRHLTGVERVTRGNELVGEYMRDPEF